MTTENKQEKILHQKHKETQNKPALGEKKNTHYTKTVN